MGRRRRRVEQEPALNDYGRQRQARISDNIRRMEDLGIKGLAACIKIKSGNNGSCEGSDSSEYLPEEDEESIQLMIEGRLAINEEDKPTMDACASVFQSGIRQMRYKLKQAYFNGILTNEIRTTSPVSCMTDE